MKTDVLKLVIGIGLIAVMLLGCITTKSPTGETVTKSDPEVTIAILQTSVDVAQQALYAYQQFAAQQNLLQEAETQREIMRQQVRIQQMLQVIEALRNMREHNTDVSQ